MKILAFAATNHQNSINKQLINYIIPIIKKNKENVNIEVLDLADYELPFYSQDIEEKDGIPKNANRFYQKIGQANYLLISFAEHNGSFTAIYKNLFDWMSRINQKVYQNKPSLIMATSPGERGGKNVLHSVQESAPYFGIDIKATISVPKFYENFNMNQGIITNSEINANIHDALSIFI